MPFITTGVELRYEMADFDASDIYAFRVLDTEDALVVSSAFADEDLDAPAGDPEGVVAVSPEALAEGRTIAVLSQGGWMSAGLAAPERGEDEVMHLSDLPPFLLSRASLCELREGETRLRPEWGPSEGEAVRLALRERTTVEIVHDGERRDVEVLVAAGEGVELTVVDDDEWPLVVERVEGDNFWRLLAVASAREEGEEEEEALPPPEPAGPMAPTGQLSADEFVALTSRLGVSGMDMDYEGTRFSLVNDERRAVIEADYKIVLVAMPGGTLRRAHTFGNYRPEQVLGPLAADDPVERSGDLTIGAELAAELARRAGADLLYPDPLGAIFVALFNVRAAIG